MAEQASSVIVEVTVDFLRIQQSVVIAVPGGRSVVEVYNHLRSCALPWDRIHMFLLDERLVPIDHPESNYKLIRQADTGIVLFFGSEKHNALHNFLNTKLLYKECPAKIMAKLPHYYLLTDQEVETQ